MKRRSQIRIRKPARKRRFANGLGDADRYVLTSLDDILSLDQCASWLQQPEPVLKRLIEMGVLKPLPLPGSDYRFHARSVLQQMGVVGESLGNTSLGDSPLNRSISSAPAIAPDRRVRS
jgi:hypothetical protein